MGVGRPPLRALERVRDDGFAVDDEETARGMRCLGTAVREVSGQVAGAISVSTVKGAVGRATADGYVDELQRFARRLTDRLGGRLDDQVTAG